jgi:hypothetical protein
MFQVAYGYYAHGVGPETARPPAGWEDRLVRVEIPPRRGGIPAVAWCLERHDLVLAKLVRGNERDWDYARAAFSAELIDPNTLLARASDLPVAMEHRDAIGRSLLALIT